MHYFLNIDNFINIQFFKNIDISNLSKNQFKNNNNIPNSYEKNQ